MNCLNCGTQLEQRDHEGVAIDACPKGCGVWLDRGELQTIAVRETSQARSESERLEEVVAARASGPGDLVRAVSSEQPRECPHCGTVLRKMEYGWSTNIVIDRCSEHGVWLDGDELRRIEAYSEGLRDQHEAIAGIYRANLPSGSGFVSGVALWDSMQSR